MTDNKERLLCPACNKEMAKINSNDISIDICLDGCGGIYFDNRELNKFDEPHENIKEILEAIKDKNFETVDENETRVCPICKIPMVKMGAGVAGVKIDVCNVCGAKFLDNGELLKIREDKDNTNDSELLEKINLFCQKDLEEALGIFANLPNNPSQRRQFFQDLIYKILTK